MIVLRDGHTWHIFIYESLSLSLIIYVYIYIVTRFVGIYLIVRFTRTSRSISVGKKMVLKNRVPWFEVRYSWNGLIGLPQKSLDYRSKLQEMSNHYYSIVKSKGLPKIIVKSLFRLSLFFFYLKRIDSNWVLFSGRFFHHLLGHKSRRLGEYQAKHGLYN